MDIIIDKYRILYFYYILIGFFPKYLIKYINDKNY